MTETKMCGRCWKDIEIDNETHYKSDYDYICEKCGDQVMLFREHNRLDNNNYVNIESFDYEHELEEIEWYELKERWNEFKRIWGKIYH